VAVKHFTRKIKNFGKKFFSKSGVKCLTKSLKCGIIVKSAASGRWPAAKMNPLVALQGGM
jgi:hypothetical protein